MRLSYVARAPRAAALASAVLAVAALSGCAPKKPNQPTASQDLGSAGGTVQLEQGGAMVQVPQGALSQTTNVTLTAVDAPVPVPGSASSQVVEFTPHGTQFAIPVSITLPYTGSGEGLTVLRLANAQDTAWRPVGGVRYESGKATFESTTFSYYVVTSSYTCTPASTAVACSSTCNCCGTASCVDTTSDPNNCGACGTVCGAGSFCGGTGNCSALSPANLCANKSIYVINGELPPLSVVSPQQTTDGSSAQAIANALASQCAATTTTVSQAQAGILDPCSDAPLLKGGTTMLVVGGTWTQRLAKFTQRALSPVVLSYDPSKDWYAFNSRGGAAITAFPNSKLSPKHDYFVISLEADPARGGLIFQVYGMGWEGTPAAVWYFQNKLLPEIAAGTPSWQHYLLVEWTDNGNGVKDSGDTWTVLARDTP